VCSNSCPVHGIFRNKMWYEKPYSFLTTNYWKKCNKINSAVYYTRKQINTLQFGTGRFLTIFSRFTTIIITSSDGVWILTISYLPRSPSTPHSKLPTSTQWLLFYTQFILQHGRRDVTNALLLPSLRRHSLTKYKMATSSEATNSKTVCYHTRVV
jgi:hypothetical protein